MSTEPFELPLGSRIDLRALAKAGSSYHLTLPQAMFPRLKESCRAVKGDAELDVRFYQDLQGLKTLEGSIKITVTLICERCLQPFDLELVSSFKSTPDAAKVKSLRLEDKLEVVDLDEDGLLDFYDYLEDCLLLEVPFVPRHEREEDCGVKGDSWSFGQEEAAEAGPFAALKSLKLQ